MKFTKVAWGVLLVLPTRPLPFFAESALIAVPNLRDKAIVSLTRLEPTGEIHHPVDLATVERTNECFFSHAMFENDKGPIDCEGAPSVAFARLAKFDWVRFELGGWFLPRPVPARF